MLGVSQGLDGEVEIAFVLDCPCDFMCIFNDYETKDYTCYCAPNFVLAEDQHTCLGRCLLAAVRLLRGVT